MTGEVTLRGAVLPVGGIKAKVLAAHRAGLKTVILPERNQKDLVEVPEEVRAELKFVFVSRIQSVLEAVLEPANAKPAGSSEPLVPPEVLNTASAGTGVPLSTGAV